MHNVHLTLKSANAKTGPIPVSVTSDDSCPKSCPFNDGACYAKSGPLAIHWRKVSKGDRGMAWGEFIGAIESLPDGQLWRHNAAGDLPGDNETINPAMLGDLVAANRGKKGFTYTHKTNNPANFSWIKAANEWGFTVNLSANDLAHADKLANIGAGPVVTVLPIDAPAKTVTPHGRVVITCPATYRDDVNCATCKLCAIPDRKTIIGFPAHGAAKKRVEKIFFMRGEK